MVSIAVVVSLALGIGATTAICGKPDPAASGELTARPFINSIAATTPSYARRLNVMAL